FLAATSMRHNLAHRNSRWYTPGTITDDTLLEYQILKDDGKSIAVESTNEVVGVYDTEQDAEQDVNRGRRKRKRSCRSSSRSGTRASTSRELAQVCAGVGHGHGKEFQKCITRFDQRYAQARFLRANRNEDWREGRTQKF